MKLIKNILLGFLSLLFLLPAVAKADGGIFPPPNFYVTETDQKAVIIWEDEVETMVLSITFKGNPADFGWVIPVPAKPQVTKSSDELFTSLAELTQPQYRGDIVPLEVFGLAPKEEEKGVEIIETKEVGIYDITVLTSDDPKALAAWLSQNNYQIPSQASTILEDYTKNSWYFVAAKINLEKLTATSEEQLKTGHATPLKIQFKSDKIIYPLKLSSIISAYKPPVSILEEEQSSKKITGLTPSPQVAILLYVIADHKKALPGFDIQYADWLKKDEIEKLAYEDGESWYTPEEKKLYLTKLYRLMRPAEMTDDLIARDASDNKPVGGPAELGIWFSLLLAAITFTLTLILLVFSPLGLIFIICSLIFFYTSSKIARIICWVLQILFFLLLLFLTSVSLFIYITSGAITSVSAIPTLNTNYIAGGIFSAALALILIEIFVMIRQWRSSRRQKSVKKDNPEDIGDKIFQAKEKK